MKRFVVNKKIVSLALSSAIAISNVQYSPTVVMANENGDVDVVASEEGLEVSEEVDSEEVTLEEVTSEEVAVPETEVVATDVEVLETEVTPVVEETVVAPAQVGVSATSYMTPVTTALSLGEQYDTAYSVDYSAENAVAPTAGGTIAAAGTNTYDNVQHLLIAPSTKVSLGLTDISLNNAIVSVSTNYAGSSTSKYPNYILEFSDGTNKQYVNVVTRVNSTSSGEFKQYGVSLQSTLTHISGSSNAANTFSPVVTTGFNDLQIKTTRVDSSNVKVTVTCNGSEGAVAPEFAIDDTYTLSNVILSAEGTNSMRVKSLDIYNMDVPATGTAPVVTEVTPVLNSEGSKIDVSWEDNNLGTGAYKYLLEVSNDNGATWGTPISVAKEVKTYSYALDGSGSYKFRVSGVFAGDGTTPAESQSLSTPTITTVSAVDNANGTIKVDWTVTNENIYSKYKVQSRLDDGEWTDVDITDLHTINAPSTANGSYIFKVTGMLGTDLGTPTDSTDPVVINVQSTAPVVTADSVVAELNGAEDNIIVTWGQETAPTGDGAYVVELWKDDAKIDSKKTITTRSDFNIEGLNGVYFVKVYGNAGDSSTDTTAVVSSNIVIKNIAPKATSVSTQLSTDSKFIEVSWEDEIVASGDGAYKLEYAVGDVDENTTWTTLLPSTNDHSYNFKIIKSDKYTFRVMGVSKTGDSDYVTSSAFDAVRPATVPTTIEDTELKVTDEKTNAWTFNSTDQSITNKSSGIVLTTEGYFLIPDVYGDYTATVDVKVNTANTSNDYAPIFGIFNGEGEAYPTSYAGIIFRSETTNAYLMNASAGGSNIGTVANYAQGDTVSLKLVKDSATGVIYAYQGDMATPLNLTMSSIYSQPFNETSVDRVGFAFGKGSYTISNFKIVTNDGTVLFDQQDAYSPKPYGAKNITTALDATKTKVTLNWEKDDSWKAGATFTDNTTYKVEVSKDGAEFVAVEGADALTTPTFEYPVTENGSYVFKITGNYEGISSTSANSTAQVVNNVAPTVDTLTADFTDETQKSITATWTPETGKEAAGNGGYKVEYSTNDGVDFTTLEECTTNTSIQIPVTVNGKYVIRVSGVSSFGKTDAKTTTAIEVVAPNIAPVVDTVTAQLSQDKTTIKVDWTASTAPSGDGAYKVEVSTNGTDFTEVVASTTSNTYTYNVPSDNTYTFRVTGTSASGNSEAKVSSAVVVDTTAPIVDVAPVVDTVTADLSTDKTTINVAWTATTEAVGNGAYKVEVSVDGGAYTTVQATTTSKSYTYTVPADGSYVFRVTGILTGQADTASKVSSAVVVNTSTPVVDVQPVVNTVSADLSTDKTTINVAWTATTEAAGNGAYKVEVSVDGGAYTTVQASTTAKTYAYTVPADGSYVFRVTGILTGQADTASKVSSAVVVNTSTPVVDVQPVVNTVSADLSTDKNTINVAWTATTEAAGNGAYKVEVSVDGGAYTTVQASTTAKTYAYTVPADGSYVFRVTGILTGQADTASKVSCAVVVDTSTPVVDVAPVVNTVSADLSTDKTTINVAWTATTEAVGNGAYKVEVSVDGGEFTTVEESTKEKSLAYPVTADGSYVFRVSGVLTGQADTASKTSSAIVISTPTVTSIAPKSKSFSYLGKSSYEINVAGNNLTTDNIYLTDGTNIYKPSRVTNGKEAKFTLAVAGNTSTTDTVVTVYTLVLDEVATDFTTTTIVAAAPIPSTDNNSNGGSSITKKPITSTNNDSKPKTETTPDKTTETKVETKVESKEAPEVVTEKASEYSESNKDLLAKTYSEVKTTNNGNKPVTLSYDVSGITLSDSDKANMVAVRIDPVTGEVTYLGGRLDETTSTFTTDTKVTDGDFAVIVADPSLYNQATFKINDTTTSVNGESKQLDAAPQIVEGTTFMPVRAVSEALGAEVTFNAFTKTATVTIDGVSSSFKVGESQNGEPATFIENGRILIPVRAVSEALGANVNWFANDKTIQVTK